MPIIPEVLGALDKIRSIHKMKNDDYASNENPYFNFDVQADFISLFKNGTNHDKAFASIIGLKIARLANLLGKKTSPNNESIEDTFIDCATYLLLWRAHYLSRNKNQSIIDSRVENELNKPVF